MESYNTMTPNGSLEVSNGEISLYRSVINIHLGHNYMAAVAQAIESAQHEILIMDWWLNPELVCCIDIFS